MMENQIVVMRQAPIIEEHLVDVKNEVIAKTEFAKSLICTVDSLKKVKETRAELNKDFAYLESVRKEIKRAILSPYEEFERKYKEYIATPYKQADSDLKAKIAEVEDGIKQQREAAPTIGYYAMFEYLNGFRKSIYWSKEKMLSHADRYSSAFSRKAYEDIQAGEIPDRDMWKYSSFWYKDFDGMACKTMLRQLISKWGVMSIEMQQAFEKDATVADIDANGKIFVTDPDAPPALPDTPDTHPVQDPEPPVQPEEPEQIDLNSL